jgi:CheY-like chemotaxis protein
MDKRLKILLLEDMPSDAELIISTLLNDGFDIEHIRVDNESQFIENLISYRPDLVISDYSLPQYTGVHAIRAVKKKSILICPL